MGETNYGSGYEKTSLTIELVVLAYKLNSEYKEKFEGFYDTVIKPWLRENYVSHANSWIIGDYLIVVSSSPMPPWNAIPGLDRYLEHPGPVRTQALPKYVLPPNPSAASYAAD